jgi:hypothetical protein
MAVCESDSGGALNGSTMDVQRTEKAAKMSRANSPLMHNVRSLMNSFNSEHMSAR